MSLKFEQLDNYVKNEFGSAFENNGENEGENVNDLYILDEFLDKRLYDDQQQANTAGAYNHQPQQQPQQQTTNNNPNHTLNTNANNLVNSSVNSSIDMGNPRDEEMFNNFLTDEINKNDFVMFSPGNNIDPSMNIDYNDISNGSLHQPPFNVNATTPMSFGNSPDSKSDVFHTPNTINANDNSYENARNILSNLKFGTDEPTQYNNEFPKEYLEIDETKLPYKLTLENLPAYSRVETQIKLDLSVFPPPPQFLIQLPKDTIAKQKFCLSSPLTDDVKSNVLSLETFVLTATGMKPCNTCTRCIRREQKRASRRKTAVTDNLNWATTTNKRAIIFNCKEIISFPPHVSNENSKNIDISARIVCYCRHHSENKGFKLLFILKNTNNEIIAKHLSTPIMIMDRKKSSDDASNTAVATNSDNNAHITPSTSAPVKVQPLSPTSIEEDSSEPHTTDSRMLKRKKTWSPELSDGFSITPQRKSSSGINLPASISMSSARPINDKLPMIQRIIPAQGPLRGGIEVTLLGTNFKQGLNVNFGINKALSTQCWSDSTMVTYLPPASQPGQVIVTVEDPEQPNTDNENKGSSIFTYLDDTERQMIELALQIVGLKMNGKLEDARNIARKIIGSESNSESSSAMNSVPANINSLNTAIDQFSGVNDEDLILKVIEMLPTNPNLSICTPEAQTLLHLSCLKGYYRLVSSLLHKGARVDLRDINGYTPLHLASIGGKRTCIELLLSCKANLSIKNNNGETAADVANINVLDLLKESDVEGINMSRKFSSSSISSSIFSVEDFSSGTHVSRLTNDAVDYSNDNSEGSEEFSEDEEDLDASDEDSEYSLYDEESLSDVPTDVPTDINTNTINDQPTDLPTIGEKESIWNKVRNVFNEELPRYDDLFPNRSWKITAFSQNRTLETTQEGMTDETISETVDISDSEDIFQKFSQQRKNIQNDKMLLFVWLPLLILIVSSFILMNVGWNFEFKDDIKEFIRKSLGDIMLGNERFKVVLNKHLSQVNDAVTSVINVS